MIGPLSGRVRSQTFTEEFGGDPRVLAREFATFLERSSRLTRQVRVGSSIALTVGLAFVASRVDRPIVVGLCGVMVLAPLVWLATAVLVPMSLIGRANLARGAGVAMQAGVPVAFGPQGVSAGDETFAWNTVTGLSEGPDGVLVQGVDVGRRRVFEISVGAGSFESDEARRQVVQALEQLRQQAGATEMSQARSSDAAGR
ncbi:MAG: hypothetical protein JNJ54_01000 [Myxococcaceae bacterium]|nr:hypothetical protein [Myxococcaceae bacterium]